MKNGRSLQKYRPIIVAEFFLNVTSIRGMIELF